MANDINLKNYFLVVAVLISFAGVGCRKEKNIDEPSPGGGSPGTKTALLKQIIQDKLPSPAYHFYYDKRNQVSRIELSSGLFSYDVLYDGLKVNRLENKKHQSGLKYLYENNRIRCIQKFSGMEETVSAAYYLDYHFNGLLKNINYFEYGNNKTDSLLSRTFSLMYHDDGNLASVEEKRIAENGTLQFSKAMMYGEYDEGKNMEGTGILRDFFDELLYLPEMTLQKNNPAVVKMAIAGGKFLIRNHFQYDGKIPVLKMSKMTQTGGTGMGDSFTFMTRYTYY